ncbi:MAG TPA: TrkA family potassium uptake protein [Candidatus Anoxymicrobiaceae bacterium]
MPKVASRLIDPKRERTFARKHIEYVDSTTMISGRVKSQLFQGPDSIVQQDRTEVGIQVIEFGIGDEANGKPAGSLNYGISSKLLILLRDNKPMAFDEESPLRTGDRVVMTLRREGWAIVRECMGSDLDENTCPGITAFGLASDAVAEEPPSLNVIVGGCSQVGAFLAVDLAGEGHKVTLVDEDPSRFKRVPPEFTGEFVEGSIDTEEALIKAGIQKADAFVAVSKSDESNRGAVELARNVFKVPRVMSRVFEPREETAYQELGMPYTCGTRTTSQALAEKILNPMVRSKSACLFNQYDLVEFECPSTWEGKRVLTARNSARVIFAYIVRRSTGYMAENNFVLREDDTITALVTARKVPKLEKFLLKISR